MIWTARSVAASAVATVLAAVILTPAWADDQPLAALDEGGRIAEVELAIEEAGANWVAGPTSISGLPLEELDAMFPDDVCSDYEEASLEALHPSPEALSMRYPDVWDWREMNGVTPPKNQAGCGSCWAHAGCAAVESHVLINEGIELDLSEQQAIDCNFQGGGCNGGLGGCARLVYEIHGSIGAVAEDCYPYEAADGTCHHCDCPKVAYIDGFVDVPWTVEDLKYALYNYGPIPVGMQVYEDFQSYSSGCYEHVTGAHVGGHVVLCVGWDMTMCGGEGAWIMKNHSGTYWGEGGFAYMKMPQANCFFGGCGLRPLNAHIPRSHRVPDEFATLQAAADASARGDTIKVAGGTYGPVTLPSTRILLGGYDPTFSVRNPELYPTTIDGNGFYAVVSSGVDGDCYVIDGFRITADSGYNVYTAMILWGREITLRNCEIYGSGIPTSWEYGAELSMDWDLGGAAITVEDCVFRDLAGYALDLPVSEANSTVTVTGNLFSNNELGIDNIADEQDLFVLIDGNTFDSNTWGIEFGSSAALNSECHIKNNIVTGNTYGIRGFSTDDYWIGYNDVWGNVTDYSGCTPDTSCISVDPLFCDSAGGDYTLHGASPCLGTGEAGADMGALAVGCPTGPQNFAVVQAGASVDVTWDAPAWRNEVDHYVLYRDTTPDCAGTLATFDPGTTSFVDVSLPPCDTCYYQVSCVDISGIEGGRSSVEAVELCYNPAISLVAELNAAGNQLTWTDAGGPVDYYLIERGASAATLDSVATVGGPYTTYADIGLACPRDNYTYQVSPVYNTGWRGVVSNQVSLDPAPAAPFELAAEWSDSDAVLTWSAGCESDINAYRVYCDTVPMTPPPDSELLVGFTSDTTFVDEELNTDWTYFYRITSVDENNHESGYSDIAYVGHGQMLLVPSTYTTIQAAIDAAAALDTVLVNSGTYSENITLKEGVFVLGEDTRAAPLITSSTSPVIQCSWLSDLSLLAGFTIDGQGTAIGLEGWATYLRIEDCLFQNCSTGANFKFGGYPTLSSNRFTASTYGVAVADSARPFLTGNTIDLNTFAGIQNMGDPGPEVGRTLADANDIMDNAFFQIFNTSVAPVDADYNYWGNDCVGDTMFFGPVGYVPWTDATHTESYTECGTGIWDVEIVGRATLGHNFPNPFNPSTAIGYSVPSPGGHVNLSVYDLSGRKVRTLVDAPSGPGEFTVSWRGNDGGGLELGSGVYFYRLEVGDVRIERKMVLMK